MPTGGDRQGGGGDYDDKKKKLAPKSGIIPSNN